jgi:hypothetical protein
MKKSDLFCLICAQRTETLMQYVTIHDDLFEHELETIRDIVDKVTEFNRCRFVEEERLIEKEKEMIENHENLYHSFNKKEGGVDVYENC